MAADISGPGIMRRRFPLLLVLSLALCGCGFEAPAPQRTPARPTPAAPLSTIAATLTIPESEIARLLNEKTQAHIADLQNQPVKCGVGRCRLNLLAQRTGVITVSEAANGLELHLPFMVHAQLSASGFFSMLRARADGQGEAVADTRLDIAPDWSVQSHTQGEVHLEQSHLRIGPLVTNLADVWNDNQETLSRPLWRALDKQLSALPIRRQVAKFWTRLFVPISLSNKFPAWLVLRPEKLRLAGPVIGHGGVSLSLSLEARGQVVSADAPPPNKATPLPAPVPLGAPSDKFAIAVPVLLSYDEAARLAMASLAHRPPRIAGMDVRFSQLRILPSGDDVVLAARFCADPPWDFLGWFSSCGTGYLRGVPEFDAAQGIIRVTHVHYDIATANLLLGTMRALAGDALAKTLQDHLVFDESREMRRLYGEVRSALAKPRGRDVAISADIQSFGAPRFTWTRDGFLASLSATGRVTTQLHLDAQR
jgi:hypothetical protein